jgi:hypothetical protein
MKLSALIFATLFLTTCFARAAVPRWSYGSPGRGRPYSPLGPRKSIHRGPPTGPKHPPKPSSDRDKILTPIFRWDYERQYRSDFGFNPPNLQVRFPNGNSDKIILRQHIPIPELVETRSFDDCLFLGRLQRNTRSSVAVTGCPGDSEVQVTIVTASFSGQYVMIGDQVSINVLIIVWI